jgi:pyruvate,orthophosphate dikinase
MTRIGLPVPPGFTISTSACNAYLTGDGAFLDDLWAQIDDKLTSLERELGRAFGGSSRPLLLSVRSGAAVSMPGMMDTILNLGLNDQTTRALAEESSPRFAYDCYRRLIQMFSNVVLGIEIEHFEDALDEAKRKAGVRNDQELDAASLARLVESYKAIVVDHSGEPFPSDPHLQLRKATLAVFDSWNNRRAINYRRQHGIPDHLGTAVTIQSMVFGNMGEDCATGVAFTRNPSTGEPGIFGEFLVNAQGEDVVAGIRTPEPIDAMADHPSIAGAYQQLLDIAGRLERHYADMQDLEFTIQNGRLFMLQTRSGKRTGQAAVNIAMDLFREGLVTDREALMLVEPSQLDQTLHPTIDPRYQPTVLATGLPASPGAASGRIVFDADDAKTRGDAGAAVILVRMETSPEDFHGMVAARGVLTARGGMTSHAAVVARGMGKPCVAGCTALEIDYVARTASIGTATLQEGDCVTIDGATGRVMLGEAPTVEPNLGGNVARLLALADEYRRLAVRTNADTPEDAATAREFGAEGIGLCRTEHMFFGEERLLAMREMILSASIEERRRALDKLLPHQRADFVGIFEAMDGYPVTIRTLDPPLHEFLPQTRQEIQGLAGYLGVSEREVEAKIDALHETNPMLGHRGCRLGISYPEITAMQARAIFEAAVDCTGRGVVVLPEVMVPLVSDVRELERQREVIDRVASEVFAEGGLTVPYQVGTMIELPRAALTADQIARSAEFFSFGTNDLTQMTFGLSRDDSGRFLPAYVHSAILDADPFVTLDQAGVGSLIELAAAKGRHTRPEIKLGICGEHGGDPASVEFCHRAGLNYVSCSPYRVPIARLAAAQAALRN